VGVAAPEFHGTDLIATAFWAPLTLQPRLEGIEAAERLKQDNLSWLVMLGRLRDDTTLSQARADLALVAADIDRRHPGRTTSLDVSTATIFGEPEQNQIAMAIGAMFLLAAGFVLLVACAH